MAQSDIESKTELAAVYHLNHSVTGITIHAGLDNADLPLPCIVCSANGADESPKYSGNYVVEMNISVHSNADDTTETTHRDRVATVREQFANDWVGISLAGEVSNYGVFGVVIEKSSMEVDDREWITTLPVRIFCKPSD